jgi:hypothetical protein
MLGVAATQHHILRKERAPKQRDDGQNVLSPAFLAQTLALASPDAVLERAFVVGKVRNLQGLEVAVQDQRGTQARADAQEQHAAAAISADRLHRSIIDDLQGTIERLREIEAHPPLSQVGGYGHHPPAHDGAGTPSDTTSYSQSAVSFFTPATMARGVRRGPESIVRFKVCPVASSLMRVPPTSTTRIRLGDGSGMEGILSRRCRSKPILSAAPARAAARSEQAE